MVYNRRLSEIVKGLLLLWALLFSPEFCPKNGLVRKTGKNMEVIIFAKVLKGLEN